MKTWAEMTERERDVLVAQALGHKTMQDEEGDHISGWEDDCGNYPADNWMMDYPDRADDSWQLLPHFSTDRAAAMTLLDGVEAWSIIRMFDGTYDVSITSLHASYSKTGNSLPEAICRAFLRAKGINIE